jgi:hypothetical protein
MDSMSLSRAMERIETLLEEAEKKLTQTNLDTLFGEILSIQHEINNARQIAASVKVLIDLVSE